MYIVPTSVRIIPYTLLILTFPCREEASRTQSELQKAKLQIVELKGNKKETCIPLMEIEEHVPESKQRQEEVQVSLSLPTDLPSQGWKVITKLNKHLMQILYVRFEF